MCTKKITNTAYIFSLPTKSNGLCGDPVQDDSNHTSHNKKQKSNHQMVIAIFWCERRDLNPYESPHTPLKRARLPIPPLSRQQLEV